jgi:hypothetical protein
MTNPLRAALLAGAVVTASFGIAAAQSASTAGSGGASVGAAGTSGTVGSGGSAAAGGTSASTLGTGGTSTMGGTTSSTIGSGGSAAAVDGKATSRTRIKQNPNMLQGQSKAKAQDGGTWSKSMTKTKVKGDQLTTRTKSMSHQPGGPPAKSTTRTTVDIGQ